MSLLAEMARETVGMLAVASPYLLLGLLVAGLLHVLLPEALILRWMGRPGLSGVAMAALVGVPLPICSCGVVPIALALRRKGASRPATLSFLTTTPESSVDSILLTWGLAGPVMALARPLAAFATALLGGILAIAYLGREGRRGGRGDPRQPGRKPHHGGDEANAHAAERADHQGHEHPEQHDHSAEPSHHDAHVHSLAAGSGQALAALRASGRRLLRLATRVEGESREAAEAASPHPRATGLWTALVKPALRYGFVDLLDDIAFWLVVGLLAAGVLATMLPDDLASLGLGRGVFPMVLMLAVGIPLYMCASASTPVAAALMAKGVSPGAALVFLLAGPATNVATILLLASAFGRRFVKVYLAAVALGALACGLALDAVLGASVQASSAPVATASQESLSPGDWLFLALTLGLLGWRLAKGAARRGWEELRRSFAGRPSQPGDPAGALRRRRSRRRLAAAGLALAVTALAASGFRRVPPDSRGYGFLFGSLAMSDLGPGLHYVPPAPVGRFEARRTGYPRKADVGYRTDLTQLAERRQLTLLADPDQWHSPVAAMNVDPFRATYLTADENLLELSFTVHYALADPVAFFYRLDHERDVVALYAEAAAREVLAARRFEDLLTIGRPQIEAAIARVLEDLLGSLGIGVEVRGVRVVDIHPPSEVVEAFRDQSSAREDRETLIDRAREQLAKEVPRARGEAAQTTARAEAEAVAQSLEAAGRAEGFTALADAVARRRSLALDLVWREHAERTLAGRQKIVLPPGTAGPGLSLWRDAPRGGGEKE
jgi:uncharacterized membrane protein YraQ (UPF0718 family)/regulator of protease activity HflC (stomatin/prohibitin superfamily)